MISDTTVQIISDCLATFCLVAGLAFMLVGAIGILRFPDAYNRLHASSKCSTLGLMGLLLCVIFHVGTIGIATKAILTIIFTFVANPIGSHILAKAAHVDGLRQWPNTLSDELAEDCPERTQRDEAADDDDPDLFGRSNDDQQGGSSSPQAAGNETEARIEAASRTTRVA